VICWFYLTSFESNSFLIFSKHISRFISHQIMNFPTISTKYFSITTSIFRRVMHFFQLHESEYEKTCREFGSRKSLDVFVSNAWTNICVNRPDRKLRRSKIVANRNPTAFLINRLSRTNDLKIYPLTTSHNHQYIEVVGI